MARNDNNKNKLPPTPQLNPTESFPNAAHDEFCEFSDPMSIDDDHDDDSPLQKSTAGVTVHPVVITTINVGSTLRAIARNA
ncbi:uncharacterized protein Bfra_012306 [Botrytis fragariae]|uniref:Uncharacterized protein n=1 Tax=Botrytis fragariae TaxID=1964551 RepID=A0A8H6AJ23_9HELO|nr:uncharacterized protein Bfra_012306 [Botrytis fragariae]KAF5868658.1 hypothetical protein Bfra_012306 [Botrytis fragariae]